jgi:hypothetical protein
MFTDNCKRSTFVRVLVRSFLSRTAKQQAGPFVAMSTGSQFSHDGTPVNADSLKGTASQQVGASDRSNDKDIKRKDDESKEVVAPRTPSLTGTDGASM